MITIYLSDGSRFITRPSGEIVRVDQTGTPVCGTGPIPLGPFELPITYPDAHVTPPSEPEFCVDCEAAAALNENGHCVYCAQRHESPEWP